MYFIKLRADEQEYHMRRRPEASWHKTTKPRDLTATVKDGGGPPSVVQGKFMLLFGAVRRIGAGCCGDWGLDTPGYPIKLSST